MGCGTWKKEKPIALAHDAWPLPSPTSSHLATRGRRLGARGRQQDRRGAAPYLQPLFLANRQRTLLGALHGIVIIIIALIYFWCITYPAHATISSMGKEKRLSLPCYTAISCNTIADKG